MLDVGQIYDHSECEWMTYLIHDGKIQCLVGPRFTADEAEEADLFKQQLVKALPSAQLLLKIWRARHSVSGESRWLSQFYLAGPWGLLCTIGPCCSCDGPYDPCEQSRRINEKILALRLSL